MTTRMLLYNNQPIAVLMVKTPACLVYSILSRNGGKHLNAQTRFNIQV